MNDAAVTAMRERVETDMSRVPTMTFPELLGFLENYTFRTFGDEIGRGDLLPGQIRAYADEVLAEIWAECEDKPQHTCPDCDAPVGAKGRYCRRCQ